MMKRSRNILMAMALLAGGLLASCSDSPTSTTSTPTSSTDATVTMQAELTARGVGDPAYKTWTILSGSNVDSLVVTRVRVLVSNLKLHRIEDDTMRDRFDDHGGRHDGRDDDRSDDDRREGVRTLKLGPMMITIDSVGTRTFAVGAIPAGTYDRVKFEVHRFEKNEVSTYLADPLFSDFVTDDRYTVIIDGRVYRGGAAFPYSYRTSVTANLEFRQDPVMLLTSGSRATIMVHVDPAELFERKGGILDPRDGANRKEIDDAIRRAFHAFRH